MSDQPPDPRYVDLNAQLVAAGATEPITDRLWRGVWVRRCGSSKPHLPSASAEALLVSYERSVAHVGQVPLERAGASRWSLPKARLRWM